MLLLDVLPHELPSWLVILFFIVLMVASFITGRWLESKDNSRRFEDTPPRKH